MVPTPTSKAPRGSTPWSLVLGILLICGFMSAAVYWASTRKAETEAGKAEQRVIRATNPCRDIQPGSGIKLSKGCKAIVDNVNIFCAQNSTYCARSERRAVKLAQDGAAIRHGLSVAQRRAARL